MYLQINYLMYEKSSLENNSTDLVDPFFVVVVIMRTRFV